MMDKNGKIYVAGHRGMVGSAIVRELQRQGYTNILTRTHQELDLTKLLATYQRGRQMNQGVQCVLVGRPNAGKSSLLNLLAGEEKAIVTDIAGTTRDALEENIRLHGISLNVIDTAGIRSTEDVVEKIGVERARKYAGEADLLIYVVDASVPLDENDASIMELLKEKKSVILLNKSDLKAAVSEEDLYKQAGLSPDETKLRIIRTSTRENLGIDEFEETIKEMFFHGELQSNDEVMITNLRHKEALEDALNSILMVERSLQDNMPEDFYSIDLMSAYTSLGFIIGEEVGDDLVNEIFSKFCMGK